MAKQGNRRTGQRGKGRAAHGRNKLGRCGVVARVRTKAARAWGLLKARCNKLDRNIPHAWTRPAMTMQP